MNRFFVLFLSITVAAAQLVCPPNSSQRGNSACATGSPSPNVNNNQCCCNFGFQANANASACVTASSTTCPPNSSQRGNSPCSTGSPNPEINNGFCCCFFGFEANANSTGCIPVGPTPATCPAFSTPKGTSCGTGIATINSGSCCCWVGYQANATGNGCIPTSTVSVVNICTNVVNGGCIRYLRGFDVTGVTNFVSLTVSNGINTACDCLSRCKQAYQTCAAWVWKFTDSTGFRTCTLYSNFNLPPNVTLGFNTGTSVDFGVIGQNPQTGGLVPHCTTNGLNNGTNDPGCVSGELWSTDNNLFYC